MAVVTLLLTVIPTYAEVVPEVTFTGGYTDNLFNDSSSLDDKYAAVSPLFKIYPSATTEIALSGSYTVYSDHDDLSNLYGRAGLTVIPRLSQSRLSLMFSGALNGRRYGEAYRLYNNWQAVLDAQFSYSAGSEVTLRGGTSIGTTEYPKSASGGSSSFGFFGGLNLTPYGSNSLNFEAGMSLLRYVTGLDTVETGSWRHPSSSISGQKSDFHFAYFSLRYSRPLGERVGVNASYSERSFVKEADSVIYGFSINYLSPWWSLWEGRSLAANIKSFPGANFILESGFTVTDKKYIKNLEVSSTGDETAYNLLQRDDEYATFYIRLQRPFSTASQLLIKPGFELGWADNSSNLARYDYADVNFRTWIYFRF